MRRGAHARGNEVAFGGRLIAGQVEALGLLQLAFKAAQQPHAVFDLRKVLVPAFRRDGPPGDAEKFVAGKGEGGAQLAAALLLKGRDGVKQRLRLRFGEGAKLLQPLTKAREAHGHHGRRLCRGRKGTQVAQRSEQLLAVVPAGAHHNLAVESDACILEARQALEDVAREAVVHHPAAKRGIGGMHAHIQRRGMAADDAVKLGVVHVGQRHEIAHHQGKAPVVVAHVKRFAQARRHLADEAKDAVVAAGAGRERHLLPEVQTQRFALPLSDVHGALPAVPLHHGAHAAARDQRLVVDLVEHLFAVEGNQRIARAQPVAVRHRAAVHRFNHVPHALLPFFSQNGTVCIMPRIPAEVKPRRAAGRIGKRPVL